MSGPAGLAAFGPAAAAALLLAGYLVVGEPIAGAVLHRRFETALRYDRTARRWLYTRLLALEWGLVALVAAVVALAPAIGWAELGLRRPDRTPSPLAVLCVLAVLGGLAVSTMAIRRSRGHQLAQGRSPRLDAPAAVAALLPRGPAERRLFAVVAVTAGICEEVLYRGFLLAVLLAVVPGLPTAVLVLLGGAAFGAAHAYQGRTGVAATGALGVVLAIVYTGTGSLFPAMALHAVIDLRILLVPVDQRSRTEESNP